MARTPDEERKEADRDDEMRFAIVWQAFREAFGIVAVRPWRLWYPNARPTRVWS